MKATTVALLAVLVVAWMFRYENYKDVQSGNFWHRNRITNAICRSIRTASSTRSPTTSCRGTASGSSPKRVVGIGERQRTEPNSNVNTIGTNNDERANI